MKSSRLNGLLHALTALLMLAGCSQNTDTSDAPERPMDPWVIRIVLDERPRMVTLALHDNLWVAYSGQTGALYKAWRGGVNFDGPVYTTVHGPQPTTIGDGWMENRFPLPWRLLEGDKEWLPRVQYRGHRFEDGHVWLHYELHHDGHVVHVWEQPEYAERGAGQVGFVRTFRTEGVPEGMQVALQTNVQSIPFEESLETDGVFRLSAKKDMEAKGLKALDMEGLLVLNDNGLTHFTCWFVGQPLLDNPWDAPEEEAAAEAPRPLGERLIDRNDCKTCHNTYKQTVGPAYVDIAKKYAWTEENVQRLMTKVREGGAGVWGEGAMTPHPDLPEADLRAMVEWIMSLDSIEEAQMKALAERASVGELDFQQPSEAPDEERLFPGVVARVYTFDRDISSLSVLAEADNPVFTGIIPAIHATDADLAELGDNFAIVVEGYLRIPKDNNYVFRLVSDDGSRLYIDGKLVIDHDGLHGADPRDGEIALAKGVHPLKVEYFQGRGGKNVSLQWRAFDAGEFEVVPPTALAHAKEQAPEGATALRKSTRIPGDRYPLQDVHPAFDLSQARPDDFLPKVGGMDFLSDGRLVVSTWDAAGSVWVLDNVQSGDPGRITVKRIASGLAEPLGLKVVDDTIFVLQKQELTKLIDHDGDEQIDEYYTLCNDWTTTANFHEFAFGLVYKDGYFYGTLAIAILPGGASASPQAPDRGKVFRVDRATGQIEFIAHGLRTPNGIGIGVDDEIFVADNQGDWLPASKILHVTEGAFFGSRAVDPEGTRTLPVKPPLVWLPQDEIGNSPSTPLAIDVGPYKGQMIHGEVTHGGVKRVFVERVNGQYQGAVFRFIQGLEAGINRMVWGPDGALYVGGIGSTGNWGQTGKLWYGLQRLQYNGKPVFEMLAVRARTNGMEIEFTEPLEEGTGWNVDEYDVQQWRYVPTADYGGPKVDLEKLKVLSANVSPDRRRVFLELDGMKPGHVVYIRIPWWWISAEGRELWSTEAWYTLNFIPDNMPGFTATPPAPVPPNTLTEAEKQAGWQLLFDGQTTNGWRNYRKQTIGSSWKVVDGALMLDATRKDDGGWQVADGGDIITEDEFDNFELRLEWKIQPCGNSGIIYYVVEDEQYDYVWQTGPEMQVLDNACHPDAAIEKHRAGDLYDLIACKYETVRPAGQWNQVRIIARNGHLEHWLNGRKVVETELWTDAWWDLIAHSKFKDMTGFGRARKGHIALQDHGDRVWYRNIKIRRLSPEE